MADDHLMKRRPGFTRATVGSAPPWRNGRQRGLLLLLLLGLLSIGCKSCAPAEPAGVQAVRIAGQTFHLELATSPAARYQGLSDRQEIPPRGGMLFVFPHAQEQAFVMRRCLVPIDLIFLDAAGRIIALHEMEVEPYDRPEHLLKCYRSGWPAQFAMELQGGMIRKLGLKVGQNISLPVEDLKRLAQ